MPLPFPAILTTGRWKIGWINVLSCSCVRMPMVFRPTLHNRSSRSDRPDNRSRIETVALFEESALPSRKYTWHRPPNLCEKLSIF
jgi:hypothetical protein